MNKPKAPEYWGIYYVVEGGNLVAWNGLSDGEMHKVIGAGQFHDMPMLMIDINGE